MLNCRLLLRPSLLVGQNLKVNSLSQLNKRLLSTNQFKSGNNNIKNNTIGSIFNLFFNNLKQNITKNLTKANSNISHKKDSILKSSFLLSPFKNNNNIKSKPFNFLSNRSYATHNELRSRLQRRRRQEMMGPLLKPLIFTVVFTVGTFLVSPLLFNYTPLSHFKTHKTHLMYTIMALNAVVFGLWRLAPSVNTLYPYLYKFFVLSHNPTTIRTQWSLLLSSFSHQEFFHFLVNMGCFYSFSMTMINVLGVDNFTSLYLSSGVISSFASLAFSSLTSIGLYGSSVGASGAISAVFASFSVLFPKAGVSFFVFPIPGGAQTALLLFTAYNLAGCILKWGTFDYAAHLGGTVVGVLYGYYLANKVNKNRQRVRYI
ncbi:hypothetical protein BVG19_g2742 [[Candida] boidinii]|nr:hypothetical protein BVG19_g2742 [[Candida] boidinii]OWB49220.1 hypothetical protein B5S27_g760 [[Candida] boidinii]